MNQTANRSRVLLGIVCLLLIVAAIVLLLRPETETDVADPVNVMDVAANAQSLAVRVQDALAGDPKVFDELARRAKRLPNALPATDLPSDKAALVGRSYSQFKSALSKITEGRATILEGHDAAAVVNQALPDLLTRLDGFEASISEGERARALPYVEQIRDRVRVLADLSLALAGGFGERAATERRVDLAQGQVRQTLDGLAGRSRGPTVPPVNSGSTELAALTSAFDAYSDSVQTVVSATSAAPALRAEVVQLSASSQALYATLRSVSPGPAGPSEIDYVPLGLLGVAGLLVLFLMRGTKQAPVDTRELVAATEQNEANQAAILRLLDEMGSLADGDLTVEATVSEDITGAIADSINFAIEALRELVSTIDGAAGDVERLARQTDASANHLAKSSENQSKQVFAATESIANMAESIEEVSGNAEQSAEVAKHSVDIAHKGAEAVRRTIDGMNTIRETIQDTSKRIKRLGESSQEIGDILELINDIAEQTNILALNASIQASMAGESGRGFAVVADEVQRLSERCTNATKQIEVLVKTIQSDTNEAVVSMERSTADVVSGATLAENAGDSLGEIETVSNQIAGLVDTISNSARKQATAAADITRNMGVLQEISAQTAENTGAASRSIKQLALMASKLRQSVDGFRLPKANDAAGKPRTGDPVDAIENHSPQETMVANAGRK
ncbi:MAG: methyl-accepting chemotaxis protein [Pseudomonadota bacterium]